MSNLKTAEVKTMESELLYYNKQVEQLLSNSANADRFMRIMINISKTKFEKCTRRSIIIAMLDCAALGLDPSPTLGYAYFIPYKDTLQLQIGYKGFINLALRSPQIEAISGQVVYENDEFEYRSGTDAKIMHRPELNKDRGEMKCAYAIATFKSGHKEFYVATKKELLAAKNMSKSGASSDSPWNKPDMIDAMRVKTAIRRLMRYLPLTPEISQAVSIDDLDEIKGKRRDGAEYADLPPAEEAEYTDDPETLEDYKEKLRPCGSVSEIQKTLIGFPKEVRENNELKKFAQELITLLK